jgi:hypothetical protein
MNYLRKFIHEFHRNRNKDKNESFHTNEEERLSPIIKKPSNMTQMMNLGHGKLFDNASAKHPDGKPTKLLLK